jgi:hypothetical protein
MGVFSFMCAGECGHPLLSPDVTDEVNAWMADGVAVTQAGGIITGSYDGYGRLDGTDIAESGATAWHRACWELAGQPGDYRGESEPADDQGWFFDKGDHDMPDPRGPRPEQAGQNSGQPRLPEDGAAAAGEDQARESLERAGAAPEVIARFLRERRATAPREETSGLQEEARVLRAERNALALRLRDSEMTALKERAEARRLRNACAAQDRNVEQILAGTLGYPKYGDVDASPPGSPDDYVTGDHTAESLAMQAARELAAHRPAPGIPGRIPRSARLRINGPGGPEDWMSWPNPDDPGEVGWRIRYGRPDHADLMFASDVLGAYAHLFGMPAKTRDARFRQVKAARDSMRLLDGDDSA